MTMSESKRGSYAHLELIYDSAVQYNDAAAGADQPLKFSVHHYRLILGPHPESPARRRKYLEAGSDAKRKSSSGRGGS